MADAPRNDHMSLRGASATAFAKATAVSHPKLAVASLRTSYQRPSSASLHESLTIQEKEGFEVLHPREQVDA